MAGLNCQEKGFPAGSLEDHEGQPLMGGGDVEGVIENAPDHRLRLEQAIELQD